MKVKWSILTGSFIMTVLVLGIVFNQSTSESQGTLRELTFMEMSGVTGGACNLPQEAQPSDKWQPEEDCREHNLPWPPFSSNCGTDGIWWNEDWACNGDSYQSTDECIEVDSGVVEYVYHECLLSPIFSWCVIEEHDSSENASDFEYEQNNSCI